MVSSSAAAAALLSTGLISLAPNLLLLLFSFDTGSLSSPMTILFLNLGQSLAAGALLGDVFLHILPHAAMDPTISSDETGGWILTGFCFFLLADLIVRNIHHEDEGNNNNDDNDDSKNAHPEKVTPATNTSNANGHQNKKEEQKDTKQPPNSRIKMSTVALNLMADAMHNFTDGLAIGASFTAVTGEGDWWSLLLTSGGGLATLSILLHEIPHELGDFCTLIQAGYSRPQAVLAQFLTALAAFVGTIFALFLSEFACIDSHHLGFITAGGFVYLSCVTILPEVLGDGDLENFHGSNKKLKKSIFHSVGLMAAFLCGIAFMQAVAHLEGHDEAGGHDHGPHAHHVKRETFAASNVMDHRTSNGHHHHHHDYQQHHNGHDYGEL